MSHPPPTPPWAVIPPNSKNEWYLTEIKQGVTMGTYALSSRPCTYLGRAHDQVHIPLAHASCSRIHARLAFDAQQNLWLRDLGSTHGTLCNQRTLPKEAFGGVEETSASTGARGIRVVPGDVLQFGASTRIYCIEGPCPRNPNVPVVVPLSAALEGTEKNGVVRKEDALSKRSSEPPEIPEQRYHKEYEQIQALRSKLANIEQESERIRAKGEWTKGQEQQLSKNQQRETELREKIDEKQQELDRNVQSDATTTIRQQQTFSSEVIVVIDEEVDDRTQQRKEDNHRHALNPEGETEESLQSKWNAVQADLIQVGQQLEVGRTKVTKLQQRVDKCDPDEVFFLKNDMEMELEQKERLLIQKEELVRRLVELKQLLLIVNPKWKAGRTKDDAIHTSSFSVSAGTFHNKDDHTTWAVPSTIMPPPNAMHTEILSMPPPQFTNNNTAESSMPPPPLATKGVSGPSNLPPSPFATAEASLPSDIIVSSRKRQKIKGPAIMPPPFVLSPNSQPRQPNWTKVVTDTITNADVWCPPKDQDGSGRSKLNDKFGGKY